MSYTSLGSYALLRPVGRGGFATVYEARHDLLGTRHAIKVLDRVTPWRRQRLEAEGRLQARLDPQLVVPVTEVVSGSGRLGLVMPLVEGCTLRDLLEQHRASPGEVFALFGALLDGVEAAHAAGVVHCDLKPENVLTDVHLGRVRVRVTDFGVARSAGGLAEDRFSGTPAYAAPEQRARQALDERADLWALGVMLVELASGARPGDGGRAPDPWVPLARALLREEPADRLRSVALARTLLPTGLGDPRALRVGQPVATALRRVQAARREGGDEVGHARSAVGAAPSQMTTADTWMDEEAVPEVLLPPRPPEPTPHAGALAQVERYLFDGEGPIWVTGPPLVGKTSLALQAAWASPTAGSDWAVYVSLDGLDRSEALVPHLARVLGLEPRHAMVTRSLLADALSERGRGLLLLDGAGGVVDAVQALADTLHAEAPRTRLLVTSRIHPTSTSVRVVRLDPAAGTSASPEVLRAALAASLDALDASSRRALDGLATFRDAFDLDDATAVLGPELDALACLTDLVRHSLVRPLGKGWFALVPGARAIARDVPEARERLVDMLARRGTTEALEELPHDRRQALARHGADLRALLATHADLDPETAVALGLAAMTVLLGQGPLEDALPLLDSLEARTDLSSDDSVRLALARVRACDAVADPQGAERALSDAEGLLGSVSDSRLRASVHLHRAELALRDLDHDALDEACTRARAASDDPLTTMIVHQRRGSLFARVGPLERAVDLLERTARLAATHGYVEREARACANLGNALSALDRIEPALEAYAIALRGFTEVGELRLRAITLANLGLLHRQRGRLQEAARTLAVSRREHRRLGNHRSAALARLYEGNTRTLAGDLDGAEEAYRLAEEELQAAGATRGAADAHGHRGLLLLHRDEPEAARPYLQRALDTHDGGVFPEACATWCVALGRVAAATGEAWRPWLVRAEQVADTPDSRRSIALARAELLLAEGRVDEARRAVEAAAATEPRALARADLRRIDARVALAEDRLEAAQDALAEALDLADQAGLGSGSPLREQLAAAAAEVGGRSP